MLKRDFEAYPLLDDGPLLSTEDFLRIVGAIDAEQIRREAPLVARIEAKRDMWTEVSTALLRAAAEAGAFDDVPDPNDEEAA